MDPLKLFIEKFWHHKVLFSTLGLLGLSVIILGILFLLADKKNQIKTVDVKTETKVTVLARNLEVPWSLDLLPDGDLIFTERTGYVNHYDRDTSKTFRLLFQIDNLSGSGEGGLLGLAVHPEFASNHYVYLYYTYEKGKTLYNRVIRVTEKNDALQEEKIIIDGITGAGNHNGGRIKFGPDGKLYITTGDSERSELAQNLKSLAGKILRLNDNGTIPADNPFGDSAIYSYGHRNPQGLAWDSAGRLWATEHGANHLDEINLIEAGRNYGWPEIRGDQTKVGMLGPVIHSGGDTWAPSGATFIDDELYFVGLRGQSVYSLNTDQTSPRYLISRRYWQEKFGRLRDVILGPDGFLYILTSNRDGRGDPTEEDDRIIRVSPATLVN